MFCADVHAHIHTTEYTKKKKLIDLIFSPPQLEDLAKSLKWRVYVQVNFRPKSLNLTIFYIIYALIDSQMRYIKGDSSFSVLPNKENSYWMWRDLKCRRDQEKLRTNSWSENVFALCEKCWMISKAIIVLVLPVAITFFWADNGWAGKRYTQYPLLMVMTFTLLFEIQIPHPK